MTFSSGEQLSEAIIKYGSLYNADMGLYVFHYNEDGAIAVYHISPKYADKLRFEAMDKGCYWEELLGFGGYIYEKGKNTCHKRSLQSCEEWCFENYNNNGWTITEKI